MGVSTLIHKILGEVGIHQDRYNLQWASAAEAPRFVKLITEYTARIKELGPLGHAEGLDQEEVQQRINKALELVQSRKLRMSFGKATTALRKDNDYSEAHRSEVIDEKVGKAIKIET